MRIVGDVHGKPLFEDEAVSGLIAARPLGEVIETVIWSAAAGRSISSCRTSRSPSTRRRALRWLSVVFALAALPLCWDVGRRLGGPVAGAVAALVVATSSFLLVYGTFARMYTLYVFAAALAVDLFLVANERRTGRWAFAAAGAAWLLPAIHPYGAFLVAAEALVALWLWRGRPFRPAIPTLAVGVAMIPFAIADLRLADRFAVGLDGEESIAAPTDAWGQLGRAFSATAGGRDLGGALHRRADRRAGAARPPERRLRRPVPGRLPAPAGPAPPRRSGSEPVSPRHLVYVVPLVGALIGVAVARAVQGRGELVSAGAVVLTGVLLVAAPFGGIRDPRDWQNDVLGGGPPETALGSDDRVAAPAAWLNENVEEGDVLYPYSAVYWAGLPATGDAEVLPYSQRELILRAVDRAPCRAGGRLRPARRRRPRPRTPRRAAGRRLRRPRLRRLGADRGDGALRGAARRPTRHHACSALGARVDRGQELRARLVLQRHARDAVRRRPRRAGATSARSRRPTCASAGL